MRLQLISDLHTEFYHRSLDLCTSIEIAPDLDFLVIAGDLVVPALQDINEVMGIIDHFSSRARHVVYVEGNHEYYGGNRDRLQSTLREVIPSNFNWLRNNEITLEGVHFYGGTMWFPNADGLDGLFRDQLNDWSQIKDLQYWVYGENAAFTRNALELVRPETIVVSHHLPHRLSTPKVYENSACNRFFISDQSLVIEKKQPRLWFHGHTHTANDYILGKTKIVCNPYGYFTERKYMKKYSPVVFDV